MTRLDLTASLGRSAIMLLLATCAACGSRSATLNGLGEVSAGGSVDIGAAGGTTSGAGGPGTAGSAPTLPAVCTSYVDCPAPANGCSFATCKAGQCGVDYVAKGERISFDATADCQAFACNGLGDLVSVVNPSDLPKSDSACLAGTCDGSGTPGTAPVAAGAACSTPGGGQRCDGNGSCVQCLTTNDCASGQTCAQHACVASACMNGLKDGAETGIDCGGECAPCGNLCSNQVRDGHETDVDCGGECAPCSVSKKCVIDQDCSSDACDPLWLTCLPATCIDQKIDRLETDVDCGGGECAGCLPGQACFVDTDCTTLHCDAPNHRCGGSACNDHRLDGDESDVDCGGLDCGGCNTGQKCDTNFDCFGGCNSAIFPHRCN